MPKGAHLKTQGLSKHPLYQAWCCMKERCYRVNHSDYHNYGGRGIKVCPAWHYFPNFLSDMGERPTGVTLPVQKRRPKYAGSLG